MNISPQINFDVGPDIKGTWKNMGTGDTVCIRDTIIEDGQIIGLTPTGQQIPYSRLQRYVKVSDEITTKRDDPQPRRQNMVARGNNQKKPNPYANIDDFDFDTTGNLVAPGDQSPVVDIDAVEVRDVETRINNARSVVSDDISNVMKVLESLTSSQEPKVRVSVAWDGIPEGIIFLKKYLQVSNEDIIKGVLNKYVNVDEIVDKISSSLTDIIMKALEPETGEVMKSRKKKTTKGTE